MRKLLLLPLAFTLASPPIWAAVGTTTLSVAAMTCAVCPITVKTALSRVPGVEQIQMDFPKRLMTVRYDDTKTPVAALEKATCDVGYPSHSVQETSHE
ncbi:MAG: mercury resistance system periplasmic binding protein MerP [Rhodanobacteraceae bacterium]|nr:MAG: mercury resistance system periplasmic binding protein MerP [Rhodanobacteraceae bacterium]